MHLIQILLPAVAPGQRALIETVCAVLADRFGGVTAYDRAPAQGLWRDQADRFAHDIIVVVEVVVEAIERPWWSALKARLEHDFRQQEVMIRALPLELLR